MSDGRCVVDLRTGTVIKHEKDCTCPSLVLRSTPAVTRPSLAVGLTRAIEIVKQRKAHYELYRCNCQRIAQLDGHAVGCRAEMMETKPATFAILDEIEALLTAELERSK